MPPHLGIHEAADQGPYRATVEERVEQIVEDQFGTGQPLAVAQHDGERDDACPDERDGR